MNREHPLKWVTLKCKTCGGEDKYLTTADITPINEDLECFKCNRHPITGKMCDDRGTFR